ESDAPVPTAKKEGLPLVLIIEDNADVVHYLSACLEQEYSLAVARNGQEGIDKALESVPDLIISDVMMPEKDGFEVCQTLKTDVRTSHIPIVMLTAKADIASKIEGLESGADAYLAKPFNKQELLVRLKKLMELRKNLQQYYRSIAFLPEGAEAPAKEKIENTFLQKVRDIVVAHLPDPEFELPRLCREVTMSYSQLYRKLMALTGHPPTHFIRDARLAKAKALLLETELTVAEVAYDTGFTDPGYFTRVFTKEFGMSPTEFRRSQIDSY
ncbi:MAG: response regulator transcription factor, partial [Saprospiraceae bacterium]